MIVVIRCSLNPGLTFRFEIGRSPGTVEYVVNREEYNYFFRKRSKLAEFHTIEELNNFISVHPTLVERSFGRLSPNTRSLFLDFYGP
jgi:hypothetical protein